MISPLVGPLRYARASALAGVTVVIAAAGHALAGGGLPPVWLAVTLGLLTLWATTIVTRWRLRAPAALAILGVGQVGLHYGLGLASSHSSAPASLGDRLSPHAGHELPDGIASAAHAHGGTSPWMLAAHAAAVIVTALLVAHGENFLWRLWGWLTAPLPRLLAGPAVVAPAGQARFDDVVRPALDLYTCETAPTRGPPSRFALAA
jgi:hypothetical protein